MARAVALSELRTRALLRADFVNSSYRTATLGGEVDKIINAEWRKAYDLLVMSDGDYALSSYDITTVSGTDAYAVPADFYKLKGVDAYVNGSGGSAASMRPFRWHERNRYQYGGGWTTASPISYRLRGAYLIYAPKPAGNILTRLWYYPAPTDLTADAQTIDCPSSLDELIVEGVAYALCVEEGDPERAQMHQARYGELQQLVLTSLAVRDGGPEQAADVYANDWWSL